LPVTNFNHRDKVSVKVIVGRDENMKEVKPKIDHNINIAGLLVTDADTVLDKLERETKGVLKGLFVFPKKVRQGLVFICNGVEFPNAEAVDLLLYLLHLVESNDWPYEIEISGLNTLAKKVFGIKQSGKIWNEKIERFLVIWANHKFYFKNCFHWQGKIVDSVMFGVIQSFKIDRRGKGKPIVLSITFDKDFIEICKNTTWYRRPSWEELRKLRKETAKNLYLVALEYKPDEDSKAWRMYLDNNLGYWYRNTLNSLANPKYLKPYYVINRLEGAIEEINKKTKLQMELQKTEEGNYCIEVKEKVKKVKSDDSDSDKAVKIKIPFDELGDEEKSLLISYVAKIADEKGIKNIWGFLRSMNVNQVKTWLGKAKKYFGIEDKKEEKKEEREKALYVEKPELVETLLEWGKGRFKSESMYKLYFGKGNIVGAYEGKEEVLFICRDNILARLIEKNKIDKELGGVFGKKVRFVGKDSVEVEKLISKQSG
jgi:hypothetical protein